MAEGKKSFVLYADLLDNIEHLTNEEKGILFNHLLEYVNDKNPILEDRLLVTAWKPIEKQLKRDLTKWSDSKELKSKSGRIGNLKRWNLDLYNDFMSDKITLEDAEQIALNRKKSQGDNMQSQEVAKIAVNVNDNVSVNVNDICNINNSIISEIKNFDNQQNQNDIIILDSEKENNQKEKVPSKRKSEKDEFIEAFVLAGAFEDYAEEYYKYRVKKKLSLSKLAYNKIIKESVGLDINEVIELCINKDWKGFKREWYNNSNNSNNEQQSESDPKIGRTRLSALEKLRKQMLNQ